MTNCNRYPHSRVLIHRFSHCVTRKGWIKVRNVFNVLTEGKAEFSHFR